MCTEFQRKGNNHENCREWLQQEVKLDRLNLSAFYNGQENPLD